MQSQNFFPPRIFLLRGLHYKRRAHGLHKKNGGTQLALLSVHALHFLQLIVSCRHPVVFIKQGTTPTNVVRKCMMSIVATLPQGLNTSCVLLCVHCFLPAFT